MGQITVDYFELLHLFGFLEEYIGFSQKEIIIPLHKVHPILAFIINIDIPQKKKK